MRRITVLVFLIVFAAVTGSAMGTAAKKTLYFAHFITGGQAREILDRAVSTFEETYPDVKIEHVTIAGEYFDSVGLQSLFATGQPPDVYLGVGGDKQIGPYVEAGSALDLNEILSSERNWEGDKIWVDTFFGGALASGRMEVEKEKLYILPAWGLYFDGVWYNVDVFSKVGVSPPETYGEWSTICQKIKDADTIPIVLGNKHQWQGGHWMAMTIQRSAGKKAYEDLMTKKKSYTDPDIVKAFSLIGDMVKKGFIIEGVNSYSRNDVLPFLFTGKAGMEATAGTWHIKDALEYPEYNFDFFRIPKVIGGKGDPMVAVATKFGWVINAKTKHRNEAISFLKALTSFEVQKELAEIGTVPVTEGAEEFLHPVAARAVRDILAPAPSTIIYSEDGYEPEYQQFFQDAVAAILGGEPVERVLREVQEQAKKYQQLPQ